MFHQQLRIRCCSFTHTHKNVLVNHPVHSVAGSLPGDSLKVFEYFELRFILHLIHS